MILRRLKRLTFRAFQLGMASGSGLLSCRKRFCRRLCPLAMHPDIPTIAPRMDGAAPSFDLVGDWWRGVGHGQHYAPCPSRRPRSALQLVAPGKRTSRKVRVVPIAAVVI